MPAGVKVNRRLIAGQKAWPLLDPKLRPSSQLAKRNKPACRFIPEHEANAGQTLPQSQSANIAEIGMVAKSQGQPVERNSTAEMVDMVHADIGGEPPQHGRQIIM
jgi:hypothetical protein